MSASDLGPRPRILHVNPDVRGGMRVVMEELFSSELGDRYRMEWVSTFEGPGAVSRLTAFGSALVRIAGWSLRRRGRIVHVHATVRGSMYRKAICVLLAKVLGRQVLLHVHSGPGDLHTFIAGLGRVRGEFIAFAIERADVVVSVSAASAGELKRGLGIGGVLVIPNPAPALSQAVAGARNDERPLVLFLGGFENPVKGGAEVVEALERLDPGSLRFLLAGPGEPSPSALEAIEGWGGAQWRGWLEADELRAAMDASSIFLLSSLSEGLPMAVLEAMSRGFAIVATKVGGVPDVLDDEVEALLVEPGDVAAIAAALERLGADAELRARLGAAARERAGQMGVEEVAERFNRLYRNLLAG